MKKSLKILIGAGIVLVAGSLVVRAFKKEAKKLEEEKEEKELAKENISKGIEELGLSESKIKEEEKVGDEGNLVKAIYHAIEFGELDGELWDRDYIDIDEVLKSDYVIHVTQSDTKKGSFLKFVFEIPDTVFDPKRFDYPRINDFINRIGDAAGYMASDIIKFTPKPTYRLVGHYIVSYNITGRYDKDSEGGELLEEYQKHIKIPKEDYEDFTEPGSKHDGLFDYVKYLFIHGTENTRLKKKTINFYDPSLKPEEKIENLEVRSVVLAIEVSFPIATEQNDHLGINVKTALRCLKYLLDDFEITKKGSNRVLKYDKLMFHSKNYEYPDLGFDMTRYYSTVDVEDESGKVIGRKITTELMYY